MVIFYLTVFHPEGRRLPIGPEPLILHGSGSYIQKLGSKTDMNASTTNNDAEAPPPPRVSFENAPEAAMEMSRTSTTSYETRAKAEGMRYTISDVPPLSTGVLLGFQHVLTMLSATVLVPLIGKKSLRKVVGSLFTPTVCSRIPYCWLPAISNVT